MRTSKPISTISYNSLGFLKGKLEELERNHTISSWFFIWHHAESDEKKHHCHVWLCPNKLVDTMVLKDMFRELDPVNPDKKPLGVIDFVSSQIDDAILYDAHYTPYLAFKGESREYQYSFDDFVVSDEDWFEDKVYHALHGSEFAQRSKVLNALADGVKPAELITSGMVPLQMAGSIRAFMQMRGLSGNELFRNGHDNHEVNDESDE